MLKDFNEIVDLTTQEVRTSLGEDGIINNIVKIEFLFLLYPYKRKRVTKLLRGRTLQVESKKNPSLSIGTNLNGTNIEKYKH